MNSPRFRRTRAKPSGFTWTHGSYEDKAAAFNLSELLAPQTGDAVWNVHNELRVCIACSPLRDKAEAFL